MGLFDIFSSGPAQEAADDKIAGLNAGYNLVSGLYDQGRGDLTNYYGQALAPYNQIFAEAGGTPKAGYQAYADATGANGAAGNARAVSNFQTSPGYQFAQQQGLQAIDRGAASRGLLSSGNTLQAEERYGQGLADQEYGNYVNRLLPFVNQPLQYETAGAGGLGTYNAALGTNLAQNLAGQGQLGYQTQVGIGNANAAADLAQYNASANGLGALGSLFNVGAKLLPFLGF